MNQKIIEIIIDNKKIKALEGQTVLEVAKENNIDIPSLCYHSDLDIKQNCRVCVVEVKGQKGMHPACATKVKEGMEIITDSPEIKRARKINLELIFSQHCEECDDCIYNNHCMLLDLAKKYQVEISRFSDRKKDYPIYQFGPSVVFDSTKCIDCRNCVEVCKKQEVNFFDIKEKDDFFQIFPTKDKKRECIYCGQCAVHCPVGAFEAVGEFEYIEKPIKEKDKIVIFQIAPSIRTSIGEEFGLEYGTIVTERIAGAIKKLGANKVFDTSVGADFTTMEEAKEFIGRLKGESILPMFTSCCPGWVKFVEFYYPEFIPHLTTVRSPHILFGGLIKTYWAKKEKIDPKKIVVVSVVPCMAKKYEAQRKELLINGLKPVDYVLTTRELARLFIKHGIDLKNVTPEKLDDAMGSPSGAGVVYGASGGVMESALRTVYEKLTEAKSGEKNQCPKIDFIQVRGAKGLKKAEIKIGNRNVKVAVASGLKNAKKILEELKDNPKLYDYVEIMACFGGCIGGGGQPVPTDSKIREKRASGLYQIDNKKEVRLAEENPIVKEIYNNFLTEEKIIKPICHTKFYSKSGKRDKVRILKNSKKTYAR